MAQLKDLIVSGTASFSGNVYINGSKIDSLASYPIGAVYMSSDSTSPASLFGGTWERIQSRFVYAGGSYTSGNGTGTSTGAASGDTGATTLKTSQIPSHTHTQDAHTHTGRFQSFTDVTKSSSGWFFGRRHVSEDGYNATSTNTNATTPAIHETGGGESHTHTLNSHTHKIPYISFYVWRRTA